MLELRSAWSIAAVPLLVGLAERPAEAYVDPGSASYVFQLVIGALLGAMFVLRTYWSRLVAAVRSVVSRDAARTD